VVFEGYSFGFRVFTHENTYGLSAPRVQVREVDRGVEITCDEFVWAGDQQRTPGRLRARVSAAESANLVECSVTAEMERPLKAAATIVRGIPRGRVSAGGAPFFDPRDDELLLGYPFSGGDLFGPQSNGGLTTPLVLVQPPDNGPIVSISCADD